MRAEFDAEQPPVRVVQNGKNIHVFIALHGAWETHSNDEAMDQQRVWRCDYREIITEEEKIDLADVKAHPENYLNWEEPKEKTIMERRVDELEATTDDMILMMADLIGGAV